MNATARTVLCLATALAACGGNEARSLVVVALTASPARPDATSAAITVGASRRTFQLKSGLSATVVRLGLFLDEPLAGPQPVRAEVTASGPCNRLVAEGTAALTGKKGEIVEVALAVLPSCEADAGAGADGPVDGRLPDAARPDLAADAPAPPPPDAPDSPDAGNPDTLPPLPSLGTCTEFEHGEPRATCDPRLVPLDSVYSVALSPHGNLAATAGTDGRVKFWKVNAGRFEPDSRPVLSNPAAIQPRIAFSPDGTLLAVSSNEGDLALYNLADRSQSPLVGHAARVRGLAFLADGTRLVTVDRSAVIKVWDVPNRREVSTLTLFESVTEPWALAITTRAPASAIWAAVGLAKVPDTAAPTAGAGLPRDGAYVWFGNLGASSQFSVLKSADEEATAAAISPDGRFLVSGGDLSEAGVWDIQVPAQPARSTALPAIRDSNMSLIPLTGLAFDAMGRSLAAVYGGFAVGGGIRLYAPGTWATQAQRFQMMTYYPVSVALAAQGNVLLAGEVACSLFVVCAD
jgi:hypothetical protein